MYAPPACRGWRSQRGKPGHARAGGRTSRVALFECRSGGGEAGDRDTEGRAGDVVEPELVTESDRGRIATVLAADSELELRACGAALLGRDAHERSDTLPVDALERVGSVDLQVRDVG